GGDLLGVRGVPAGAGEQLDLRLRGQDRAEQLRQEPGRVLVGERRQRDRQRVRLSPAPVRTAAEQLRPRGADNEQRDSGRPIDQVIDEVQQVVVRPVQVLEDEYERPFVRKALEEPPPGGERLVALVTASLPAPR